MVGDQIREVERGIHEILKELRGNPYALETVFIGVIGFAGNAKTLAPLTELIDFQAPTLPLGSGTDLGAGLSELMKDMNASVQRTTAEKKGDWKPLVFLFTDGAPTADPSKAISEWIEKYKRHCNLTTIIFGERADVELLRKLGENVYRMTDLSKESFAEFFKWISSSVGMTSMAVANGGEDGAVAPGINLEKAEPGKLDDNFAIMTFKCPVKKKAYLAKYENAGKNYNYVGAYPIDEENYKSMSGGSSSNDIDTNLLNQLPKCPHCGNDEGFIECNQCRGLFCSTNSKIVTCPWCGNSGEVAYKDNFKIGRNLG